MSDTKVRCIIKRPDEPIGHVTNISVSLNNLQRIVQGYIEYVRLSTDLYVICNEEGLINDMPYNCSLGGHQFFGDIIIIGADPDNEESGVCDLPITFKEYKETFFGGKA
jgi:hypothetical protein